MYICQLFLFAIFIKWCLYQFFNIYKLMTETKQKSVSLYYEARDLQAPSLIDHVKKFSTSAEVHDHIEIMCCFLTRMDFKHHKVMDPSGAKQQQQWWCAWATPKKKGIPSWFYCLVGRDSAIPTMGKNDPCNQRRYSLVEDRKKGTFSTAPMKKALWNYGCTRMLNRTCHCFSLRGKGSIAMRLAGRNLLRKLTANPSNDHPSVTAQHSQVT